MKMLVTMHIESEGPGTLRNFFESRGAHLDIVRLHYGEELPPEPTEYEAIVCMGGPMNIYETDKYPFLGTEAEWLKTAVAKGVPLLGICLGAQMAAHVCGAKVIDSPKKELGWSAVTVTEEGRKDPLFEGLPETIDVVQWHGDMFEIPEGGLLLATGEDCPNQAFRLGKVCGVQFHVEATDQMLEKWFAALPEFDEIMARYNQVKDDMNRNAETLFDNFLGLVL